MHKALWLAKEHALTQKTITILYKLIGTWSPLYEDDSVEEHFNLGMGLAGPIHAQHSETDFLNNYGTVQSKRGNYTKALAAFLQALDIMNRQVIVME
jgi:Tfp pilus assembly protein PilF